MITFPGQILGERYLLILPGKVHVFELESYGFRKVADYPSVQSAHNSAYQPTVYHTMDPITAVALGLVTPEDLGGISEGFRALLNLLNT